MIFWEAVKCSDSGGMRGTVSLAALMLFVAMPGIVWAQYSDVPKSSAVDRYFGGEGAPLDFDQFSPRPIGLKNEEEIGLEERILIAELLRQHCRCMGERRSCMLAGLPRVWGEQP